MVTETTITTSSFGESSFHRNKKSIFFIKSIIGGTISVMEVVSKVGFCNFDHTAVYFSSVAEIKVF